MDSMPSANRWSASGEKTATCSRSGSGRRAAAQSELSLSASSAIVSQMVAVLAGKKFLRRLDGAFDLGRPMCRRDEERLELRGRDVDAAREQVPEERAVAVKVARLGIGEVLHGAATEEDGQHRADALDGDVVVAEAGLQGGGRLVQLPVDVGVPQTPESGERRRRR